MNSTRARQIESAETFVTIASTLSLDKPETGGKTMTRKDYMENRITHLEYYGNVARIAGIRFSEEFLTRCDKALTAGDEHLNTIPLSTWDMMGAAWRVRIASALKQVNNTGGVSLSDLVCTLKSAAIIWINKG